MIGSIGSIVFCLPVLQNIRKVQPLSLFNAHVEAGKNFKGLSFRQEIINKSKKFTLINDSKATSFSSSANILKSLTNVFWLVGGVPKKGDRFLLTKKQCKSIKAYIFGKNKKHFIKNLEKKVKFQNFKN